MRPVIVALAAWGDQRLAPEDRSMVLVDAEAGAEAEPILVDARTGRSLDDSEAYASTAGPAAGVAMRERHAETDRRHGTRGAGRRAGTA